MTETKIPTKITFEEFLLAWVYDEKMTYENAENGITQNCRKLKIAVYTKLSTVKIQFKQNHQKSTFCLIKVFFAKILSKQQVKQNNDLHNSVSHNNSSFG
jgi:hypothetical protein